MIPENQIIYLDNAATTFPKPEVVYQAMDHFYRNFGGNAGRGSNPLARKASALIDETRSLLRSWLDAPEVVFQPSATIALNTVIFGAELRAGDVVYVSPFEHNSVLRPLEHLRKTIGIRVEILPFDHQTLECKLDEVKALFRLEPPTMVCVSLVSNVLGLILPVDEICQLAKQTASSTITVVDGAQAAGLLPVDMSYVDALVFSGHKSLYGPYGIAGIAFGTDWCPSPIIRGGTGTQSESIEMPDNGPSRFESGSQNIVAVAGLNASLKWLKAVGRGSVNKCTSDLSEYLIEGLCELSDITVFLPTDLKNHWGIVSFRAKNVMPQAVEAVLGSKNISVRSGLHCAPWAHRFTGTLNEGGTVRISPSYFNSHWDVSNLCAALHQIS